MGKLFDLDSPIMRFLSIIADLMILNILMILCCIPIITAGAGFTGMHYVLLRMVRNEEGYIAGDFFKSFKANFKQATVIWLILFVFICIFAGDWVIYKFSDLQFPKALVVILIALFLAMCMVLCYVFPVLSRFDNTVPNTLKNSFLMSILSLPKTLLMMVIYIAPIFICYFFPRMLPFLILFGFSATGYVSAMLYNGTFKRFEPGENPLGDNFSVDMAGFDTEAGIGQETDTARDKEET